MQQRQLVVVHEAKEHMLMYNLFLMLWALCIENFYRFSCTASLLAGRQSARIKPTSCAVKLSLKEMSGRSMRESTMHTDNGTKQAAQATYQTPTSMPFWQLPARLVRTYTTLATLIDSPSDNCRRGQTRESIHLVLWSVHVFFYIVV